MLSLLGMAQLHRFYGGFVKYLYASAAYAFVKVGGAECLALYVEVRYIELEHCTHGVTHHFLLRAVARHLAAEQLAYDVYLAL